jgi:chromosome segregation ATPase
MTTKEVIEKYKWIDKFENFALSTTGMSWEEAKTAIFEHRVALQSAQARIEILEEQHGFDHSALQSAQARIEELERAIREALALLGTGECNINTCDACKFEDQQAIYVLNAVVSHKQPPPRSEEK